VIVYWLDCAPAWNCVRFVKPTEEEAKLWSERLFAPAPCEKKTRPTVVYLSADIVVFAAGVPQVFEPLSLKEARKRT
jgi:hypothetical protein